MIEVFIQISKPVFHPLNLVLVPNDLGATPDRQIQAFPVIFKLASLEIIARERNEQIPVIIIILSSSNGGKTELFEKTIIFFDAILLLYPPIVAVHRPKHAYLRGWIHFQRILSLSQETTLLACQPNIAVYKQGRDLIPRIQIVPISRGVYGSECRFPEVCCLGSNKIVSCQRSFDCESLLLF